MRSVDREGTLELGPDCMRDGNETGPLSETAGREPARRAGSTPEGRRESRGKGSAKAELETVRR